MHDVNLNLAQRAAVENTGSPLSIVAGPGTGKTKTLTAHIAHLQSSYLRKEEILLGKTNTKTKREKSSAQLVWVKISYAFYPSLHPS